MKLTSHILTVYMLALSLVPCGDGGGGITDLINHLFGIEHQHQSDHSHHSKGCGDDTCTPFCVCSCCSMSVNVPTNVTLTDKQLTLNPPSRPSHNSNFSPSGFNDSIWQPPKFS